MIEIEIKQQWLPSISLVVHLKVHGWCLHAQATCCSIECLSAERQSLFVSLVLSLEASENKQKACQAWSLKNVFSPFEALQHRKCQAVLEGCLLVSCFCIYWCISLAKTNRMPKDMLNFHLEPEARQVKKSLFSGDLKRSPEQF